MTRHYCTEEQVRKEHPAAICIESSRQVRLIPETEEERRDALYRR